MSGIGDTGPLLMPGEAEAPAVATARLSSVPDLLPPVAVMGRPSAPAAAAAEAAACTADMEAVLAPMPPAPPPPPPAAAASDSHTESMEELVAKRSPIDSHVWKCACGGSIGCCFGGRGNGRIHIDTFSHVCGV